MTWALVVLLLFVSPVFAADLRIPRPPVPKDGTYQQLDQNMLKKMRDQMREIEQNRKAHRLE